MKETWYYRNYNTTISFVLQNSPNQWTDKGQPSTSKCWIRITVGTCGEGRSTLATSSSTSYNATRIATSSHLHGRGPSSFRNSSDLAHTNSKLLMARRSPTLGISNNYIFSILRILPSFEDNPSMHLSSDTRPHIVWGSGLNLVLVMPYLNNKIKSSQTLFPMLRSIE